MKSGGIIRSRDKETDNRGRKEKTKSNKDSEELGT